MPHVYLFPSSYKVKEQHTSTSKQPYNNPKLPYNRFHKKQNLRAYIVVPQNSHEIALQQIPKKKMAPRESVGNPVLFITSKRATCLLEVLSCLRKEILRFMGFAHTGWQRCIEYLIFKGHFAQKSPMISGSFAERDLQLEASYASSPPCTKSP